MTHSQPPRVLRLAAHPLRWRLLRALAHSDRQVRELCALTGQPQSLVSYHLGLLHKDDIVARRRSSADGRDSYYRLELERCSMLLQDTGAALHPGLRLVPDQRVGRPFGDGRPKPRVLFLCTGNSARSQMAEALVGHLAGGAVDACSAGSHPKPLHPEAVRAMADYDIDISGRGSKHLSQFAADRFDVVISLCDRVREVCPEFPGHPDAVHWSVRDPAGETAGDDATAAAFRRTAAELATRVRFFLADIDHRSATQEAA